MYVKLGEQENAMKYFNEALKIQPKLAFAHNNLGNLFKDLKKFDEAIQYYDKIQILHPNVKRASIEKYEVFTELGSADDAFLAAQGITIQEAKEIKDQAKENDYSVQHAYSLRRFYKLQKN